MDEKIYGKESDKNEEKEMYECAIGGQPLYQDTYAAAMPVETTDARFVTTKHHSSNSSACKGDNRMQEDIFVPGDHVEPFSFQMKPPLVKRLSDVKGEPVVEGSPNDEHVELEYLRMASPDTSSTRTSGFSDLDTSHGSSQLSRCLSGYCDTCKLLMQDCKSEETKQFWRDVDEEGPERNESCHKKFFEKFLEKMRDRFTEEDGLKSKTTINLLKQLLKIDGTDKTAGVRLVDVIRIIQLFGPIKEQDGKCVLISQLHELIKKSLKVRERGSRVKTSWFVGEMTREDAEKCLLACKDRTYMIRISGTDGSDGDFVLSVKHNDHCHHIKIQGNPEKSLIECPYHARLKFAGGEFRSLPDVVDYIAEKIEIQIDKDEGEEQEECSSVSCMRVYLKSPLNGAMCGYEKSKR